jgi:single-stranded DNA-specific DHH superfamily exonuclease
MNKLFDKAISFLRESKKTLIVFDTDGDGIGSAVIMAKAVKRAFNSSPNSIPRSHGKSLVTRELIDKIKGKFDLIAFLDIAADEIPEYVEELAQKSKVLILDHHLVRKDMNGKRVAHLNSSMWQKKIPSHRYCTSKMAYDLCSRFVDIQDMDWLAAMGILNDMADKSWKPFLKEVFSRNKITFEQLRTVNNIVTSSYQFSKNKDIMVSFQACLEALSPFDILYARTDNAKMLKGFYDVIENEIKSVMKSWKEKADISDSKKLIMLELDSRFSINSTISTLISIDRPHYTVMVARKNGKSVSISLRRQDKKVDCNKLAKELIEDLENANGGGHVPAAGIKIMAKDWNTVKKRAQDIL